MMKPEEDAYGQEIWAHHSGRQVFEIVERDDGYIDPSLYGPKIYFTQYEEWSNIEKKAMELVKGRVLDVGCGAGRHSLHLQEKGFEVIGIDNSPLAVKVCRLRGVKNAQLMSIEDISFPQRYFDTVIMMGNNFGLLANYKKAKTLLRSFHEMTSMNALIIADTRDPYDTDNPDHLEYHRLNKERGRMGGQVRIRIRFGKYIGRWFDYLMVSKKEMKDLLAETGWRVREFIDSDTAEYIAILEKETPSPP